jgi:MFS family permease
LSLVGCLLCGFSYTCFSFLMSEDESPNEFYFIKNFIVAVATICLGIGFSFYLGSFYSYFPLLIEEKTLFTAFGFLSSINSIVIFFFMMILEHYYNSKVDFERIFIFFCLFAMVLIILLEMYERKYKMKKDIEDHNDRNCEVYLSQSITNIIG